MEALEFLRAVFQTMGRRLDLPARCASRRARTTTAIPGAPLSQVLLVDDNPVQLQIRETILRQAGFRVAIATSAESALVLLRTAGHHFGLVITDHIMPGTSGAEFVRRLRASGDHVPVIVLSGLPDAEIEYEGLNIAFRLKPLPPPELIELAREWMKGRNAA